jgi:hypothetical protein
MALGLFPSTTTKKCFLHKELSYGYGVIIFVLEAFSYSKIGYSGIKLSGFSMLIP